MQTADFYERYHRQIILKGFGMEAQQKLAAARVVVVGAGGLGCPVLMALAGAGVGEIGIVDDGKVELSNLHRQFLYRTQDAGKLKADCAKDFLKAMNDNISVTVYPLHITNTNAIKIISSYDIVIDGTDNFQTRYMLNDACALLGKPLIYGAVSRFEGQVAVFNGPVTYRDIFPDPPKDGEVANCSEAGVLGVLPNLIGNFMANECIKLLTGTGETLTGKLLTYSAGNNGIFVIEITPTPEGFRSLPKSVNEFEQMDYPALCGIIADGKIEIEVSEFIDLMAKENISVIDVREPDEIPALTGISHQQIPLASFLNDLHAIKNDKIVFVCQSGKRSLRAAAAYREMHGGKNNQVYSLKGGVLALIARGSLV